MKHLSSKLIGALAMLTVAFACVIALPTTAWADTPDVMLRNLTSIADVPVQASSSQLTDNYGNTYSSALYISEHLGWGDDDRDFEYILDGKYSRLTGILYVKKGERDNGTSTVNILADGQQIYSSPLMSKTSKAVAIDIDIKGHNILHIDVNARGGVALFLADAGLYRVKPSEADPVNASGQNIFRMYNSRNGEHLYTTDTNEADTLLRNGWKWESTASVPRSGDPVYRLCNPYTGEHLYTTSFNEYKQLSSSGWTGEGEKFHTAGSSGKPFYRLYNPWGSGVTAHTYTTDTNELNTLTGRGWKSDGVCWYGLW